MNDDEPKVDGVDAAFATFIGICIIAGMLFLKFEVVARFGGEIMSMFSMPNIFRWR